MKTSSDEILDAVIRVLESQNRDLNSVTLTEAKELTYRLLVEGRTTTPSSEIADLAWERSFQRQDCSI